MSYVRPHRSRSRKGKSFTVRGHNDRRVKRGRRARLKRSGMINPSRRKRKQARLKRSGRKLKAGLKFNRSGNVVRDRNAGRTRTRRRKQAGKATGKRRQAIKRKRRKARRR